MISASESGPTLTSWLLFNPNRNARHETVPRTWSSHRAVAAETLRELAPYAALLALPGGSLIVLSLWLYRRQRSAAFT